MKMLFGRFEKIVTLSILESESPKCRLEWEIVFYAIS